MFFPSRRERCRGRIDPHADFHSHPWAASPMSQEDRLQRNQRYSVRIQFDASCRIQKLVPYVGEPRLGEVYERQGRSWKLIGQIKPEDKSSGLITPVRE